MHCVWNAAQIFKSNIPLHGVAHLTSTEFHFSELLPIWLLLICQGYAHVTRLRPAYILNLSSFEGCRNPLTVIPFFFFLKAWVCSQSWGLRLHMSDIWLVFILIKIIINKKAWKWVEAPPYFVFFRNPDMDGERIYYLWSLRGNQAHPVLDSAVPHRAHTWLYYAAEWRQSASPQLGSTQCNPLQVQMTK